MYTCVKIQANRNKEEKPKVLQNFCEINALRNLFRHVWLQKEFTRHCSLHNNVGIIWESFFFQIPILRMAVGYIMSNWPGHI